MLLNNTEAEHLPGCNLAIRKDTLDRIGGFRAEFKSAGDDVDCLLAAARHGTLRFVPGAMVWHHRRFTVKAYLKQQRGYGYAEALLMKAHPGRFGPLGGARWRGGIYGDQLPADHPSKAAFFTAPLVWALFRSFIPRRRFVGGNISPACCDRAAAGRTGLSAVRDGRVRRVVCRLGRVAGQFACLIAAIVRCCGG